MVELCNARKWESATEKSIGHGNLNRTKDAKAVYYNNTKQTIQINLSIEFTHFFLSDFFTIPLGWACAHPFEHTHTHTSTPAIVDCASDFIRIKIYKIYNRGLQHLYFLLLWRCHWPAHQKNKLPISNIFIVCCAVVWHAGGILRFPSYFKSILLFTSTKYCW